MDLESFDAIKDQVGKDDKRLYMIGDTVRSGHKISSIYSSSTHYIIFKNSNNDFGWEIEKLSPWGIEGVAECRRLMGIGLSNLGLRRRETLFSLLAAALANTIQSTSCEDVKDHFIDVETYINKYNGELEYRHASGPNFEIYIKKDGMVNWFHRHIPPHLNQCVEEFYTLHSLAMSVLPRSYRVSVSRVLSAALSSAFGKREGDDTKEVFSNARLFIYAQIESYWKVRLLFANIVFVMIFILMSLGFGYFFEIDGIYVNSIIAGVVGAMISVMQRNGEIIFSPYENELGFYAECISRLILGFAFGLLVVFLAKSELALAPFKNDFYAMVCFSFIAGFSERFVPDLMSNVIKKGDK